MFLPSQSKIIILHYVKSASTILFVIAGRLEIKTRTETEWRVIGR